MLKLLIIDDEVKARNILHHYLVENIPQALNIVQADSADHALQLLHDFKPDLVFLDIEMPVKSGFDFLVEAAPRDFEVIFTTAYNQYAIQAIRCSALDYLLKPIDPEELKAAVQRHLEQTAGIKEKEALYDNLVRNLGKPEPGEFRIAVSSTEGTRFFNLHEIIRIEADSSYAHLILTGNRRIMASRTLKHFEEMLEGQPFLRVHKSHLIHVAHIRQINADHTVALMSDGSEVEISRRKKEDVKALFRKKR